MSLLVYGYWLLYKVQFSYGKDEFTAMAVNRAVSSHPRSTSGCFGTSGRVSDWPQDFGGQGGVVAGADSTPGSYYLSASPGALALACSAGLAGQRLAGRAEPPAPRRKGGRRRPGRNLAPGVAGTDLLGASPVSPRCWAWAEVWGTAVGSGAWAGVDVEVVGFWVDDSVGVVGVPVGLSLVVAGVEAGAWAVFVDV